jgi:hypothetical protein
MITCAPPCKRGASIRGRNKHANRGRCKGPPMHAIVGTSTNGKPHKGEEIMPRRYFPARRGVFVHDGGVVLMRWLNGKVSAHGDRGMDEEGGGRRR